MSQSDTALELHSESEQENGGQVVPVQEAIRYRKRAQAAEQKVQDLSEHLHHHDQEKDQLKQQLQETRRDLDLTQALVKAGVEDLEVGLLLAQKKLKETNHDDMPADKLVEILQSERAHLFQLHSKSNATPGLSRVLKSSSEGSGASLQRMAQKATYSGNQRDMLDYLRMRRSHRS